MILVTDWKSVGFQYFGTELTKVTSTNKEESFKFLVSRDGSENVNGSLILNSMHTDV